MLLLIYIPCLYHPSDGLHAQFLSNQLLHCPYNVYVSLLILVTILLFFLIMITSFTRKSATSFFAAYDALCEEGTATPVCKALDEIADISVSGKNISSNNHHLNGFVNHTGTFQLFCHV
jgi:hypothetical protein